MRRPGVRIYVHMLKKLFFLKFKKKRKKKGLTKDLNSGAILNVLCNHACYSICFLTVSFICCSNFRSLLT